MGIFFLFTVLYFVSDGFTFIYFLFLVCLHIWQLFLSFIIFVLRASRDIVQIFLFSLPAYSWLFTEYEHQVEDCSEWALSGRAGQFH